MSRREPASGHGFELALDADGGITFEVWTADGGARVASGAPLVAQRWYTVRAAYDAVRGRLALAQVPKVTYERVGDRAVVEALFGFATSPVHTKNCCP